MAANSTWQPPPWTSLNFTRNCTLAAHYLQQYYQNIPNGPGIYILYQYFHSALPPETRRPTLEQTIKWYNATEEEGPWPGPNNFTNNVIKGPRTACQAEFCATLNWEGNPDLVGIGMICAYYIEAVLASLFFIAIALYSKDIDPFKLRSCSWMLNAFFETSRTLIASVILFSISVLVGSITLAARSLHGDASSAHDVIFAQWLSWFSAYAVLSLWQVYAATYHRKWVRRAGLTITWVLLASFTWVMHTAQSAIDNSDWPEWEVYCFIIPPRALQLFLAYSHYLVAGYWPVVYIAYFFCKILCVKESLRKMIISNALEFAPWGLSIMGIIMMWAFLAAITQLHMKVHAMAGSSYQESTWGFGQVVALGTWVPVLLELGSALYSRTQEGTPGSTMWRGIRNYFASRKAPGTTTASSAPPAPPPPQVVSTESNELTSRSTAQTPDEERRLIDHPNRSSIV